MGYNSSSGRIALFWEKSPQPFPWLPGPILRQETNLPSSPAATHGIKTTGPCHKERSPQGAPHPYWRCAGTTALRLRSRHPVRASRMVFLPPQAAHDSSSPLLGAVCIFPRAMSQAQPLWCCLGPGSLLKCGCVHQEQARTMLKQECSNSQSSLCGSGCLKTYSYPPHTARRDKMAASFQAAVGYLHCLMSVIILAHALCVRVVRDQRGGFPARDAGRICGCVCSAGFTDQGFADHILPALQHGPQLHSCGESIWGCSRTCLLGTTRLRHPALALQGRRLLGHVFSKTPPTPSLESSEEVKAGQCCGRCKPMVQSEVELRFGWDGKCSQFLSSRCSITCWHKKGV